MNKSLLFFLLIASMSFVGCSKAMARREPWIDEKTLYTHDKVKLYAEPGSEKVVHELFEDTPLQLIERRGKWLLVMTKSKKNRQKGWIPFFRLTPCKPIEVRKHFGYLSQRGSSNKYVSRIRDFKCELPGKTLLFTGEVGILRKSAKEGGR